MIQKGASFLKEGDSGRSFPGGSDGKASVYNAGDPGSIPGMGRSPGEGNGNPLRDFSLENPMDRGAWRAMVCRVAKSWTRLKQLSTQGMLISCFRYSLSSLVAQTVKHLSTMRETRVRSLDWEDPLEEGMATHSSILPGEPHGQRSLAGQGP